MAASFLYVGHVAHLRLRPRRHALRYRCYWLLVDLDDLPQLGSRLALFSHNRWNLFSLHDRDYGDRSGRDLRTYVAEQLSAAGLPQAGASIRLLTMPRVLGYAFNPISIYFCHAEDGALAALLYEVRNTFGERHSYLIPVEQAQGGIITQHCSKAFYVSPFLDMALSYRFRIAAPAETAMVSILASDAAGPMLTAVLRAKQRPLTDQALGWLLLSHPLLTLKVIAAIHYEALWLVLKGIGLRPRPRPPVSAVSVPSHDPLQRAPHV